MRTRKWKKRLSALLCTALLLGMQASMGVNAEDAQNVQNAQSMQLQRETMEVADAENEITAAAETPAADTITCYVRAEADAGTAVPLTKVTMSTKAVPSFASYGLKNAPADVDYITPLHILLQAMKNRGMTAELSQFDIGSGGWITDIFGWGMDNLWCVRGIDPPKVSAQYRAEDGDSYTFYQANGNWGGGFGYTGYGFFGEFGEGQDYTPKSAVETMEMTVKEGESAEFKYLFTSSMHTPQYGPCYDTAGGYTEVYVGKNGNETVTAADLKKDIKVDSEGKFRVTFPTAGTYVVSARYYNSDGTRGACNAYCKVTVEANALLGDVNGDGVVNLSDAITLLNKVTAAEEIDASVGDVNGDGTVNLQDAIKLLNMITSAENE